MASVPAENTAALPLTQLLRAPVPSEAAFQFGTLVLQVPFGVVPAPAVVPFKSQNGSFGAEAAGGDFCVVALVMFVVVAVAVAVVFVIAGVVFVVIAGVVFAGSS